MKNLSIKIKLVIIFILIKVLPLLFISYIAYEGVLKIEEYLTKSTKYLFNQSKEIILDTANASIEDSIKNLDKKSQESLEKVSYEIAKNVADFLYERDNDILFLSKLELNKNLFEEFYKTKNREVIIHDKYVYDDNDETWKREKILEKNLRPKDEKILEDNKREFNYIDPYKLKTKLLPIYKEVVFFDLNGIEKYKVSQISKSLKNVSIKSNTYINSEDYFDEIKNLNRGEIYVSDVIGEYIKSPIIGTFTKTKAKKSNIEFEPEKYAYAGKENPLGKHFEGIIRFITPYYKNNEKIGYISLALDHEHIMQFTDTVDPTGENPKQEIADANSGNYAFMWDYEGRNISHARDYFIVGFNKETGKREIPWLSTDVFEKYKNSNLEINQFLKTYPIFEEQTLAKKPAVDLIKEGNIGLDCRYLNFAPQCDGWMQLTKNGGFGSFIIYWSKVWKLTTAATIPYYTGKYGKTKRGFGFVTIGANVDEFHAAANETKRNVSKILENQTVHMKDIVEENGNEISVFIKALINELTIVTFILVVLVIVVALMMSSYLTRKIQDILIGTQKFASNELDYRIKVTSNDELGQLEKSFNEMAAKIDKLLKEEKELNEKLGKRVEIETTKQKEQEQILIHQSKLASMGEMIGNIAHQWRQPLNALGLVIQNIKFSYEAGTLDDETMNRSISKAELLTKKMSKTIDDFRNFFKTNKLEENFELNAIVDETLNLLDAMFHNNRININRKIIDDRIDVRGYSSEFSQVILNILTNAKDELVEKNIKDATINVSTSIEDNYAIVEIHDNGNGIEENILDRIFEPYFTTKEEGKGSGIGLYMSKIIIENNMRGKIFAKNEQSGASFTVKIPYKNRKEV